MSKPRKVYQNTENLSFVYKKNAKAEGNEFTPVELSPENFRKSIETSSFVDTDDFLKNNPTFIVMEESFSNIEDIPEMRIEKEKQEPQKDTATAEKLLKAIEALQERIETVEAENKELKKGKLNLSFENVQQLVEQKANLLKSLNLYLNKKNQFEEFQAVVGGENHELLSNESAVLSFAIGANEYNKEKILKTSSPLIIGEFIPFIIQKLESKCKELTAEIETITF